MIKIITVNENNSKERKYDLNVAEGKTKLQISGLNLNDHPKIIQKCKILFL